MRGQTKKPILTDSINGGAELTANLFVARDGTLAAAGSKPYGVTVSKVTAGETIPVDVAGITIATAASAWFEGY